jgi:hypothetical protein
VVDQALTVSYLARVFRVKSESIERLVRGRSPLWAGVIVALGVTVLQVASVSHYGMTSDLPALYWAGDRTLYWLGHPTEPGALDYKGPEPAGFHTSFKRLPAIDDPMHYPVLPGFIAASTSAIFHSWLGWLDVIDGHHVGLILLNAVALVLFCIYACRLLGVGAGIAATIAMALFPSGIGRWPNDAKDWPCAQFYALTILSAAVGLVEAKSRYLLHAGVLLGFALSCKINVAFGVATLILWTPIAYFALFRGHRPLDRRLVIAYFAAPFVGLAVFIVLWPWLYYGRPSDWWNHVYEYLRFMGNYGARERPTFTAYPLKAVAFMTPPVVLVAALVQAAVGWRGGRKQLVLWSLQMLWVAVPIVRIAMPHSNFYDANRHFIEYIPALCVMAGCGSVWLAARLTEFLDSRIPRFANAAVATAWLVAAGMMAWPVVEYHPYEVAYFNDLIGGLGGAQRKALFHMDPPHDFRVNGTEGDFWFSSARDGARDLRALAKPGDRITMCGPEWTQAEQNWGVQPMARFVQPWDSDFSQVQYEYISPRENWCWWRLVRRLESERPVVKRVERGGGLIYEIVGPRSETPHAPVSAETWYELHPAPRDRDGPAWLASKKPWEKPGMP